MTYDLRFLAGLAKYNAIASTIISDIVVSRSIASCFHARLTSSGTFMFTRGPCGVRVDAVVFKTTFLVVLMHMSV